MKFLKLVILFIFTFQAQLVLAKEKIKIGVSLPLSGEVAYIGVEIKNTLEFANKKLGNDRFELIFEDDKCQAKEATAVAHKLINIDQVKYVLATCSMSILPTASIYQKYNIPVIVTLGSASEISKLGSGIFRTSTNDFVASKTLYEKALNKYNRILAFVDENDYSISFIKNFSNFLNQKNIHVEYFKSDSDIRSLILRNKSFNPDTFLLLPLNSDTLINLTRQIRALGYNQEIYTAYMTVPKGSLNSIQGDGIYNLLNAKSIEFYTEEGRALYQEFNQSYPPLSYDLAFVTGVESYRAMTQAILANPDNVSQYLETTTFKGLMGDWKFNKNRDVDFWKFEIKNLLD